MKTTAHPEPATMGIQEVPLTFLTGINLYIAALYLNVAVNVGGFVVPGVLGLVGALLLVQHVRNLLPAVMLVGFLTVSLLAGGSGMEMFSTRLPSYVQIVAAIGCAHILLCAMTGYATAVRKTLFAWMLFVTVGVVLEALLPAFRDVSDTFRAWVFDGRFIYDNEKRDIAQYGMVRPTLFSQEPSHVSKAFLVFATGWYLLASRRRLATLLICTTVVTMFLRSPFVLLAVPLALFLDRLSTGKPVAKIFITGIPILGAVAFIGSQVFATRWDSIVSGGDSSFFTRYQGPYEVAYATVQEHPIFGVGIGAKEALWDFVHNSYAQFFTEPGYLYGVYLDYFNNALANSFMFFGLVGGIVFYVLVAYWANSFGARPLAALSVVGVFFMLDGALEGIRVWSSIAVVLGCYLIARSHASERPSSGSPPTP